MQRLRAILTVCAGILLLEAVIAQTSSDYAVQLQAVVSADPPVITLKWSPVESNTYYVYRKLKSASDWGSILATLPGDATTYPDSTIEPGIAYEYRVTRIATGFSGFGYIHTGIDIPQVDNRGGILVLVETGLSMALSPQIEQLKLDLEMDGWIVSSLDIPSSMPADSVKMRIRDAYTAVPGRLKSVFILGHIAVPYSGEIGPDGHTDHIGAWPADVYYAEMNGAWTDNTVSNTSASDERNDNIPGDGKSDQSLLPSDIELQLGRIDFSNLPVCTEDEITLTKKYLERNHAFRNRGIIAEQRALVDDNFGAFGGEAFALGGYRNFASLVGSENIFQGDYRTDMATGSYLWSYGCGGGSHTSCAGVGTSADFAGDSLRTIFTMLFGSYFGDWDRQNNLLRTVLAQGTTLSISWSGRPHWMYHHMGLGETIGYAARLSANNSALYSGNYGMRFVHIALLGDPSLRMEYPAPPSDLTALAGPDATVSLSWTASAENVSGYHIYRRKASEDTYTRITQDPVLETTFIDSCVLDVSTYFYMIRALSLTTSPSGSYDNLSTGIRDTVVIVNDLSPVAAFSAETHGDTLIIVNNTSLHAAEYYWDFGDGSFSQDSLPTHVYAVPGNYTVVLYASTPCATDSTSLTVDILSGSTVAPQVDNVEVYPNPAQKIIFVKPGGTYDGSIKLTTLSGKTLLTKAFGNLSVVAMHMDAIPAGTYLLHICSGNHIVWTKRMVILN